MSEESPTVPDVTRVTRFERAWMIVALVAVVVGFISGMLVYVLDPRIMVAITIVSLSAAGTIGLVGLARDERRARRRNPPVPERD